jgi:hypothetical protein
MGEKQNGPSQLGLNASLKVEPPYCLKALHYKRSVLDS